MKNCEICKKEFEPSAGHSYQKYCSRECQKKAKNINGIMAQRKRTEKEKAARAYKNRYAVDNRKTIQMIAKEAAEKGLSYGQYVARRK